MATKITRRIFQRSWDKFYKLLLLNKKVEIVGRDGEVLCVCTYDEPGRVTLEKTLVGKASGEDGFAFQADRPAPGERVCDLCKKAPSDLYEYFEEGIEHAICAVCALKMKLQPHKMKKL